MKQIDIETEYNIAKQDSRKFRKEASMFRNKYVAGPQITLPENYDCNKALNNSVKKIFNSTKALKLYEGK